MISHITLKWKRLYKKLPSEIRLIAKKQYLFFKDNQNHASLHFKKVHSIRPIYSARVTAQYRTIGIISDDKIIVWFWIGSHEQYNKILANL